MLPKKNRKKVHINNILYHYAVHGYIDVTIRNSETGEIIKWYEDVKPKWGVQIKPSDVKDYIIKHEESKTAKEIPFKELRAGDTYKEGWVVARVWKHEEHIDLELFKKAQGNKDSKG